MDKLSGLLVDLKLLAMEALEGLAAALKAKHQGAAGAARGSSKDGAQGGANEVDEVRMLLLEADLLAGELFSD